MSAGIRENKAGCMELYQASLERRIQQGDWNLVCRDEDLCKEVEALLSKCNAQDVHSQLGQDALSVIEASLRASQNTLGQNRLKSLVKAFEVLELAALNLYLCPWRKEYKVVKMFSGMFTHCVKPALTSQQAKELFGLLGYQPAGVGEEEELRLSSKPVHAFALLQLACAFFTARIECQLLLSAVASLGGSGEWELQLVQERRRGRSLQMALDSARRKQESALRSLNKDSTGDLNATVDLYTDDSSTETNHMMSPPSISYISPKEALLTHKTSHSNTSQSKRESNENTGKAQAVCVSSLTCQINPTPCLTSTQKTESTQKPPKTIENERQATAMGGAQFSVLKGGQNVCNCLKSYDSYPNQCLQSEEIHNMGCPYFRGCKDQGHELRYAQQHRMNVLSQTTQDHMQGWEKTPKDNLKQHHCMNKPTNDFFYVCHDCHNIHDFKCKDLPLCYDLSHNVQSTGRLQPARDRGVSAPLQKHTCLKARDTVYVVCHTCNKSHDCLCKEPMSCQMSGHHVKYLIENNKGETHEPPKPMPLHQCCAFTQPKFVCLTCKVFHAISCNDLCLCQRLHEVLNLKSVCNTCSDSELYILCRYCLAQYCKTCWFENPIDCKCGMPFTNSSPV